MSITVDAHVHLHEYGDSWVKYCGGAYLLLAVSDDVYSSLRTIELSKKCEYVFPAIGVHPWNASKVDARDALRIIETLAAENRVMFLGEVGLDRVFYPQTFDVQVRVFEGFLRIASEYGLGVNVHAAGAWKDVLNLLKRHRVPTAVFHWYTGPVELINEITSEGYYIGLNPALLVQRKHRHVLEKTPLEFALTESDGPYNYRGLSLGPELIDPLLKRVSEALSISFLEVLVQIEKNLRKLINEVKAGRS